MSTYLYLSIYIYFYLFLSISIDFYLFLSISIYFYLFLSISIYFYLFLSISIDLSISIFFYLFLSISIHFYPFLSISIDFYRFLSISIDFYRFLSFSIYFYLFLSVSIYFYLGWCCATTHTLSAAPYSSLTEVVLLLFALVVAKVHVSPFEFEYSGVTLPRFLRWETGAGWLGAFVAGLAMGLTAVATALSCPVLRPVVHLSVRPCCSKVCPHGSSYLSLVSIALAGFLPEWVLRSTGRYFILITFCNLGYSSECAEVIFLMRRPSRDDLTDRSW